MKLSQSQNQAWKAYRIGQIAILCTVMIFMIAVAAVSSASLVMQQVTSILCLTMTTTFGLLKFKRIREEFGDGVCWFMMLWLALGAIGGTFCLLNEASTKWALVWSASSLLASVIVMIMQARWKSEFSTGI